MNKQAENFIESAPNFQKLTSSVSQIDNKNSVSNKQPYNKQICYGSKPLVELNLPLLSNKQNVYYMKLKPIFKPIVSPSNKGKKVLKRTSSSSTHKKEQPAGV